MRKKSHRDVCCYDNVLCSTPYGGCCDGVWATPVSDCVVGGCYPSYSSSFYWPCCCCACGRTVNEIDAPTADLYCVQRCCCSLAASDGGIFVLWPAIGSDEIDGGSCPNVSMWTGSSVAMTIWFRAIGCVNEAFLWQICLRMRVLSEVCQTNAQQNLGSIIHKQCWHFENKSLISEEKKTLDPFFRRYDP